MGADEAGTWQPGTAGRVVSSALEPGPDANDVRREKTSHSERGTRGRASEGQTHGPPQHADNDVAAAGRHGCAKESAIERQPSPGAVATYVHDVPRQMHVRLRLSQTLGEEAPHPPPHVERNQTSTAAFCGGEMAKRGAMANRGHLWQGFGCTERLLSNFHAREQPLFVSLLKETLALASCQPVCTR